MPLLEGVYDAPGLIGKCAQEMHVFHLAFPTIDEDLQTRERHRLPSGCFGVSATWDMIWR